MQSECFIYIILFPFLPLYQFFYFFTLSLFVLYSILPCHTLFSLSAPLLFTHLLPFSPSLSIFTLFTVVKCFFIFLHRVVLFFFISSIYFILFFRTGEWLKPLYVGERLSGFSNAPAMHGASLPVAAYSTCSVRYRVKYFWS